MCVENILALKEPNLFPTSLLSHVHNSKTSPHCKKKVTVFSFEHTQNMYVSRNMNVIPRPREVELLPHLARIRSLAVCKHTGQDAHHSQSDRHTKQVENDVQGLSIPVGTKSRTCTIERPRPRNNREFQVDKGMHVHQNILMHNCEAK